MKRIFFAVLCIAISINAYAQSVVDGIQYKLKDDGTFEVSNGSAVEGDVVIPAAIEYYGFEYPVTSIGEGAFKDNKNIGTVTLPETIEKIDQDAFWYSSLTSINLPDSLKNIGASAFLGTKLAELTIPGTVKYIGFELCDNCAELKKLVLCEGIETLPGRIIGHCINIEELVLPSTLKTIEREALRYSYITSIEIPENVTTIEQCAFQHAKALKYVKIPESVKEIPNNAFEDVNTLETVELPQGLERIGDCAFIYCENLKHINLPENLKSIGMQIFWGSNNIEGDYTIPQSLEEIGGGAFMNLSIPYIVVPRGITKIGSGAFSGIKNVVSVEMHDKIVSIGDEAFISLGLEEIAIPNSVKRIEAGAFENNKLKTVTIPHLVNFIGANAFSNNLELTSVVLGLNLQELSISAFDNCPSLRDAYCFAADVPKAQASTFNKGTCINATLHVREELIEAYKAAEPWNFFGNYVAIPEDEISQAEDDARQAEEEYAAGIEAPTATSTSSTATTRKYIENGRMVIVKDGMKFNISGQRME